jgi:hypothetical protein
VLFGFKFHISPHFPILHFVIFLICKLEISFLFFSNVVCVFYKWQCTCHWLLNIEFISPIFLTKILNRQGVQNHCRHETYNSTHLNKIVGNL